MAACFHISHSHNPFASVTSEYEYSACLDNGNYTSESFYSAGLITLLQSLSSNIGNTGFYNASVRKANAMALCRADIQLSECRRCVETLAEMILQDCPNKLQAIIWQQYCTVRYSNESMFGTLMANESVGTQFPVGDTTVLVPEQYHKARRMLIDDLRAQAAKGGALRKAAVGNRTAPNNRTIYAMVQCRPDLSPENCNRCLVDASGSADCCWYYSFGLIIYMASCTIRYEADTIFYNITRLQEPLELAVSPSSSPPTAGNDVGHTTRNIIIIIVVSIVVFLTLAALFVGIFARKRMKQKKEEDGYDEFIQYNFDEIRAATNNFSDDNKLGQGGFGIVYKGKLENGREIAVKRLSENSIQGHAEFKNEVIFVAKLQHRNLVRLLGFSTEGNERLLVYEFVQNGSLDRYIFDATKSLNLDWEKRYKIIAGVARGLLYLHEDSRLQIIHCDLKASNVLLDEEMNPKISDFGLAKLVAPEPTHGKTSRVGGTHGYMAPEYASHGESSIKSDVYSFGVLVLEIVAGQKNICFENDEETSGDLLSHAWRSWRETKSKYIIDTALTADSAAQRDMQRCIHIALLCVQQDSKTRPTMASVDVMLKTHALSLPLPSKPGFYIPSNYSNAQLSQPNEAE